MLSSALAEVTTIPVKARAKSTGLVTVRVSLRVVIISSRRFRDPLRSIIGVSNALLLGLMGAFGPLRRATLSTLLGSAGHLLTRHHLCLCARSYGERAGRGGHAVVLKPQESRLIPMPSARDPPRCGGRGGSTWRSSRGSMCRALPQVPWRKSEMGLLWSLRSSARCVVGSGTL